MTRKIKLAEMMLAGAAALLFASSVVHAQGYPAKPIRVILPFAAGSATDVNFRVILDQAREPLGQPFIVEAKPGAGAVLATEAVMSAPPDGYTLMVSTSSQTISSAKAKPPFDVRKMTHIILAIGGPLFISVNPTKLKVNSVRELIDYARANPGKVNFGSYGTGTAAHLGIELFNRMANVNTLHIPFNGSGPEALALASGTTDVSMGVLTLMQAQADAGRVKILSATTPERSTVVPQYPGMKEAGLPDFNVFFWQGVAGPAGLPRDIVMKLNTVLNAALKTPSVIEQERRGRNSVYGGTPEGITDLISKEVDTWAKLIKDANITID
jgi:tripartite-type tricarboxylate transporter receptor subunit TctC